MRKAASVILAIAVIILQSVALWFQVQGLRGHAIKSHPKSESGAR